MRPQMTICQALRLQIYSVPRQSKSPLADKCVSHNSKTPHSGEICVFPVSLDHGVGNRLTCETFFEVEVSQWVRVNISLSDHPQKRYVHLYHMLLYSTRLAYEYMKGVNDSLAWLSV